MSLVNSVTFVGPDGSPIDADDPASGTTDGVLIEFNCPICDADNTYEGEHQVEDKGIFLCDTCENQYYMYPVVAPKGRALLDMSLGERVNYQLESTADTHAIEDQYPGDMAELTESLRTVIAGGLGVSLAFVGVGTQLLSTGGLLGTDLFYTVGTAVILFAALSGAVALAFGHAGALYRGYRLYKLADPNYSFGEFLRRAGNYYNRNPLVRS